MEIFSKFGITILQRGDRYFLLEDVGHFDVVMKETEITKQEAEEFQQQKDLQSMAEYWHKNFGWRD